MPSLHVGKKKFMNEIVLLLIIFGVTLKLEDELKKRDPQNTISKIFEKDLVKFWKWRSNPKILPELKVIRTFSKNCSIVSFWLLILAAIISIWIFKLESIIGISVLVPMIYISFIMWGAFSWVLDHKGSLKEMKWTVILTVFSPFLFVLIPIFGDYTEHDLQKFRDFADLVVQFGIHGDPVLISSFILSLSFALILLLSYPILWAICLIPVCSVIFLLFTLSFVSRAMLQVVSRKYHPFIFWGIAVIVAFIKYKQA